MSIEKQPTEGKAEKSRQYPIGPIDETEADVRASGYVITNYGVGGSGNRRPVLENGKFVSTVIFYSHGYGEVGEIGKVEIDASTGQIVFATPVSEVHANAERLYTEHREALEAAWEAFKEKRTK